MAKPRVFVSSTYYDLKHIRNSLEDFIEGLGYEAVLFESGDIAFHHDAPPDQSCYAEIENCHILVLIIGGRYGSPSSDTLGAGKAPGDREYEHYNSVTKQEYESARKKDIPIFIFVEKNVLAEYETYKENDRSGDISYAHVDNVNIYRLLDDILKQTRNNFIRPFEKLDDISSWLRDQWAGLFADHLSRCSTAKTVGDLSVQIAELRDLTTVMKNYTEEIGRSLKPKEFPAVVREQERLLREGDALRFYAEPFVHDMRNLTGVKVDQLLLYEAFRNSADLDHFFSLATVEEHGQRRVHRHYPLDYLESEYARLREKYLGVKADETDAPSVPDGEQIIS